MIARSWHESMFHANRSHNGLPFSFFLNVTHIRLYENSNWLNDEIFNETVKCFCTLYLILIKKEKKRKEDGEDTLKIIIAVCRECACPCIEFSHTDK